MNLLNFDQALSDNIIGKISTLRFCVGKRDAVCIMQNLPRIQTGRMALFATDWHLIARSAQTMFVR